MTPDLPKLRELCEAASDAPWTVEHFDDCSRIYRGNALHGRAIAILPYEHNPRDEEDARFIAASRTALPAALDEIERLAARQSELLALVASISQTVPLESLAQRGALLAEVGTLRAQVEQLRRDHAFEAKRGDMYKAARNAAMTTMFDKSDAVDALTKRLAAAEQERDELRALSNARLAAIGTLNQDRELLKERVAALEAVLAEVQHQRDVLATPSAKEF